MQSRQVSNFKINKMTKAQYSGIVPSQDEVYITTDEADAVLSVNGILPNAQGNVTLNIPSGTVTSVNGVSPTNGNVVLSVADTTLSNVTSIDAGSAVQTALDDKVDKSGDTMTGALKVQVSGDMQMAVVNPEIETGVLPESTKCASYYFKDVNDRVLGNFYYRRNIDGDVSVRMYCNDLNYTGNQAGFRVGFDADGNEYCLFTRCTTAPTTTSTARSNLYAVIVENYLSGKSWYRVWSDGFIEQGGFYSGSIGQNTSVEVTLLKSFKNTNYNPYVSAAHTTGTATAGNVPSLSTYISAKNKFKIVNEGYAMNTMSGVHWRACGY